MQDENGMILSDKDLLKEALGHMSEALCFLFETNDPLYQSVAFSLDSAIKLGTVVLHDGSILDASASWQDFEDELYEKHNRLKVIK